MIVSSVISSTVKGILTGVATGWMAQRWKSLSGGIAAGLARTRDVHRACPDEFEEVFELAQAGKDFELYSRARLKRVR